HAPTYKNHINKKPIENNNRFLNRISKIVNLKLLYVFNLMDFSRFGIKETLLLHPFVIVNFTHIARTVVWEDNNNVAVFIKFTFLLKLFYTLHCSATCVTHKKSFCFSKLTCGVCTTLVCYFF